MSTSIDTIWQTFDAADNLRGQPIDSSFSGVCPSSLSSRSDLSAGYASRCGQPSH